MSLMYILGGVKYSFSWMRLISGAKDLSIPVIAEDE